jgi:hypothetical protein
MKTSPLCMRPSPARRSRGRNSHRGLDETVHMYSTVLYFQRVKISGCEHVYSVSHNQRLNRAPFYIRLYAVD